MARWNSCNLLHLAPDAKRLWQFDAKGGSFVLNREQRIAHTDPLPAKPVAKNWSSLWQPKLNVAWLPPDEVFLRVIELPASSPAETTQMVELQLEKISTLPVNQIVWTMHAFPRRASEGEQLQTVVVVIVPRQVVEAYLGKLEGDGFQPDRLEVAMLDQLEAIVPQGDGAWVFPQALGGQNAAVVAWWTGGILRNLSLVVLPPTGNAQAELTQQISLILWSGELEGWLDLAGKSAWHLVADPVSASQWEPVLRTAVNAPVEVEPPCAPVDLAIRTARRAAAATLTLLPAEYSVRYRQQFVDRLWLRGLFYLGLAYAACVAVYFCLVAYADFRTEAVETQVSGLGLSYTNALSLRAKHDVLQERNDLKFAALDCWRLVAEKLPEGLTVQRFSFADGQTVSLSGMVPAKDISKIIDFEKTLRKSTLDGRVIFNPVSTPADQLSWNEHGDADYWRFGLELAQSVEDAK